MKAGGSGGHGGACYLRGAINPLSACFLICKMGEHCLPQRVAARVKPEKMTRQCLRGCWE